MNEISLTDALENGCTVWGYSDAQKIRKLKAQYPNWVQIIDKVEDMESIIGTKFNGTEQMPYFGAILTDEGRKHIDEIRKVME